MITIRKSQDRGHFDHGWLDTYHSFSFADYYDPNHVHFRALRVLNEDRVQPGAGFGMHPHRDMEIVTYVLAGALEHRDSLGTGSTIRPGEVQRMTAGTGILHSEFNPSATEAVHLLQIWILPEEKNLKPSYEQREFSEADKCGRLRLVASHDGRDGSVVIHQDADLYASLLNAGEQVTHALQSGRNAWLQVARGAVNVNGKALRAGDGAAVRREPVLTVAATANDTEVLLFDLP